MNDIKNEINKPEENADCNGMDVNNREIPETEQAEENIRPFLVMNPTLVSEDYKAMIRGAVKIMDGEHGGGFFARYIVNSGNMYSWLNLIIVYPDGLAKSLVLFKNWFKETDTESGNGVCTATPDKRDYKSIEKGELANFVKFPQYETPAMPIPAEALWERICQNRQNIPYVYLHEAATTKEIHEALKTAAEEASKEYGQGFMLSSDRFFVEKSLFEEIILENGRYVCEIRTEFDMLNLFFKDKGNGYQFSKRINGERKRYYSIRNDFESVKPATEEIVSLEDTSYRGNSDMSKIEQEVSRMKCELATMTSKYNVLAGKYNNLAQTSGADKVDFQL